MHSNNFHSTFRTWRRSAAFKQKDITFLLGLKGKSHVSRIENGFRSPGLSLAISLEVLTGMPLDELFPQLYESVEEETLARVTQMMAVIEEHSAAAAEVKRKHLRSCQDRVITRHKQRTSC
jgi:transcriptional regulator with XRE-family HTH domain